MKKLIVCMLLICGLFLMGCSQRKVAQQVKPDDQQQQQQLSDAAAREKKGVLKPDERITEQQLAKIETKEEPARFKEESGLFADIQFHFDKYDIRSDAKPVLNDVAGGAGAPFMEGRDIKKIPIQTISLDTFCSEVSQRPDVIKVDVEGAELLVLRGAAKLLSEYCPTIILAVHPYWLPAGQSSGQIFKLLTS